MDRREVMINLRDRRQISLKDVNKSNDYGDEFTNNMAINMESFYSSFKHRQVEEEKRRESIRRMIKLLYLIGSFILIIAFSVFMNSEKLRMAAQPYLSKTSVISSAVSTTRSKSDTKAIPAGLTDVVGVPKKATAELQQRYLELKEVVEEISGKAALETMRTPQAKALAWLVNEDPLKLIKSERTAIVQRYALACLYFATNGHLWSNSYNFLTGKPECDWNVIDEKGDLLGVGGCDPDGSIKVVSLWNNNLIGHVPREISQLKNLRVLSVYDNKLRGLVTGTLQQLKGLKTLYLHGNNIVGSIDFMCINKIPNMRADCHGTKSEIICKCCQVCCNPEGDCYQDGDEV